MEAPERIWTASTEGKCHVGFDTPSMNFTNEYVRADLAQAPAPVRVKALEWIAIDDDDCEVEAYAAGFRYWVFKSKTAEFTMFFNAWEKGHYPTLEAAKAAAQQDYESRILAALEPDAAPTSLQKVQTTPDAGVVAELVEALRIAGHIALADFARHPFVLNEDEKRKVAVISAAITKLGVR